MQKKKIFLILFMIFLVCASAFAQKQGSIDKLDEWAKTLVNLLTATWLKAICIIALVGICIGMIVAGRNEPGLIKKFIPWLIGTIVLLSAADIVKYFFDGAEFQISFLTNQLKLFLG